MLIQRISLIDVLTRPPPVEACTQITGTIKPVDRDCPAMKPRNKRTTITLILFCVIFAIPVIHMDSYIREVAAKRAKDHHIPLPKFEIFRREQIPLSQPSSACHDFYPQSVFNKTLMRITMDNLEYPMHYDDRGMPFGLNNYTAEMMRELLQLVPTVDFPEISPNATCVVVGSSGLLNEMDVSSQIDSYDVVFRFNNAPVKGFEQKVGHKTNSYTTYFSSIREALRNRRKDLPKDQIFYSFTYDREFLLPLYYLNRTSFAHHNKRYRVDKKTHMDPPTGNMYRLLRDYFQNRKFTFLSPHLSNSIRKYIFQNDSIRSTSGMTGLILAISLCPNPPDIAGFSLARQDVPYHYYRTFKKSYLTRVHNGDVEQEAIMRMFGCHLLGRDLTYGVLAR